MYMFQIKMLTEDVLKLRDRPEFGAVDEWQGVMSENDCVNVEISRF